MLETKPILLLGEWWRPGPTTRVIHDKPKPDHSLNPGAQIPAKTPDECSAADVLMVVCQFQVQHHPSHTCQQVNHTPRHHARLARLPYGCHLASYIRTQPHKQLHAPCVTQTPVSQPALVSEPYGPAVPPPLGCSAAAAVAALAAAAALIATAPPCLLPAANPSAPVAVVRPSGTGRPPV